MLMRRGESENWNSESTPSLGLMAESGIGITRKLEHVCQGLALPVKEGEVMGFLANTENAQRINSLVEDIHEALMDYQVCMVNSSFSTVSDLCARLPSNKISTIKVVSSL